MGFCVEFGISEKECCDLLIMFVLDVGGESGGMFVILGFCIFGFSFFGVCWFG